MLLVFSPQALFTIDEAIESDMRVSSRINLLKQYCEGLAYIHQKDYTHSDIKPSNLVISSFDPPKGMIIDFGSAVKGQSHKKTAFTPCKARG